MLKKILPLTLALLACSLPARAVDEGTQIIPGGEFTGDTLWESDLMLTGQVVVPKGASLTIRAPARIYFRGKTASLQVAGGLIVEGSAKSPVYFGRDRAASEEGKWGGILLRELDEPAKISFCVIEGGDTALTAVRSSLTLADCLFADNRVGLDVSLQSKVVVKDSTFRGNEAGIDVRQRSRVEVDGGLFEENSEHGLSLAGGSGRVTGSVFRGGKGVVIRQGNDIFLGENTFVDCEAGVTAEQIRRDVRISGNRFEKGDTGALLFNFAWPWVACNEFHDLDTAMMAARFSRPLVERNLFEGNRRAMNINNKSSFPVRDNIFRDNKEAIFIDMSSYPKAKRNNFSGNGKGVVFGIYMSADWEKKVGSAAISRGEAARVGSRNMGAFPRQVDYPGEVNARENWWGEKTTAEMAEKGPDADIGDFDDFFDRPEVSYPDFGEGTYRVDRVMYAPWAKAPFGDAGPLPGGCGEEVPKKKQPQAKESLSQPSRLPSEGGR